MSSKIDAISKIFPSKISRSESTQPFWKDYEYKDIKSSF